MKKFEFRLATALRWRTSQLQLERVKLQSLLSEEVRSKQALETLKDERRSEIASLQTLKELQSFDLHSLSSYMVGAEARSLLLQEEIRKWSGLIAKQRESMLLAERNVRLLEKLRDNRLSDWKHEFDKEIDAAAEESWLAAHFGRPNTVGIGTEE